ncbi:MAG: hypothetical protein IT364_13140 [Candidatus Hydrogenedentes bacterium]|nr:hypothetical protein [Candidatus Hydrogenedentota bacterium]
MRPVTFHVLASFIPVLAALAQDTVDDLSTGASTCAPSELRAKISEEAALLPGHPWAGRYRASVGWFTEVDLNLAPIAGFLLEDPECSEPYSYDYGNAHWTGTAIRLSSAFLDDVRRESVTELVPISWCERRYLVAPDDIMAFCNAVNRGSEPRERPYAAHWVVQEPFYLREGDEGKAISGLPEVPAAFAPYLLEQPIVATILDMSCYGTNPSPTLFGYALDIAGEDKWVQVRIDAGKDRGVLPGMTFSVVKPEVRYMQLRVVTVFDHDSLCVFDDTLDSEALSRAGWVVSTRAPWTQSGYEPPVPDKLPVARATERTQLGKVRSAGRPRR